MTDVVRTPFNIDEEIQKDLDLVRERYGHHIEKFLDTLYKRGGGFNPGSAGRTGVPGINWDRKAELYIMHLMLGKSKEEAAKSVGVSMSSVVNYRKQYEDFDIACISAIEDGFEVFEKEARRRAIDGVKSYVTSAGRVVIDPLTGDPLVEYKYSDSVLMFLMKAKRPEIYGSRTNVNFSGTINIEGARDALLGKLAPVLTALLEYTTLAITDERQWDSREERDAFEDYDAPDPDGVDPDSGISAVTDASDDDEGEGGATSDADKASPKP